MPIIASATPSDCFEVAFEAVRIAVQHMTPVILLSDGYIANGAEPWKFPNSDDLPNISVSFKTALAEGETSFQPYSRNGWGVRPWVVPGTAGMEHRIGGLEKQDITGNISYDPANHQHMVRVRQQKVDDVAENIPLQQIDSGAEQGEVLVVGWGSTYGAIKSACLQLQQEGKSVSHVHLRYIRPFPKNLGEIMKRFKHVLVPEINNGQLIRVLRDQFLVDAKGYHKIMGVPITKSELISAVQEILQ